MRMFYTRNEAKYYVSNKPGWKAVKLPEKPPVDWDNYEPAPFQDYIMSYFYYYIGHIISKPMNAFDWDFLYKLYNYFMIKSADIQYRTGKGPWRDKQ